MTAWRSRSSNSHHAFTAIKTIFLVCLISLVSAGCKRNSDVTSDPAQGSFSNIVGAWKAKTPLALVQQDDKLFLTGDSANFPNAQKLSDLPAGTTIQIDKLIIEHTIETDLYHPMGSLISGPYAGRSFDLDQDLFAHNSFHYGDAPVTQPSDSHDKWIINPGRLEK